jgi:hypothetical protein
VECVPVSAGLSASSLPLVGNNLLPTNAKQLQVTK